MEDQVYEIDRIARGSAWYTDAETLKGTKVKIEKEVLLDRKGPWFAVSLIVQEDVPGLSFKKGDHLYIHMVILKKVN